LRQVPASDIQPYGIVGDGRVARHFHHYLTQLGLPVRQWSRRAASSSPPDALAPCRTVLLLIPDGAIVAFAEAWPELADKRLVHCSGALVTAGAHGAHPLMTFGPDLYDLEAYRAIPFVLDIGSPPFEDLLPGLPNPSFTIPAEARAYYHALCVLAGNFSTLVWQKLFSEFEARFGMPASTAHPYLSRVTANLLSDAGRALTGPLSRGDAATIAANLRALEGDPFHAVYSAFVRAYDQHP
jgi:predicted short-subunit dehydrogenase-like oxidoreductase (DUF2520 family)